MYARKVANGTPYNKCTLPTEMIKTGRQTLAENELFWTIFDKDNYVLGTGPNHSNPPFEITSVTTIPSTTNGCDTSKVCGKLSNMAFKNDDCPIIPYYFSEAVFQVKIVSRY